jgi:hypothetical protein
MPPTAADEEANLILRDCTELPLARISTCRVNPMPSKPPTGSPVLPPDSLFYLLSEIPAEKRELLKEKLAAQPREVVLRRFGEEMWKGNRKQVWLLGEELTRRGIPPVFRRSPWSGSGAALIPAEDILLLDLYWLAQQYPSHRTAFRRWQRLFKAGHFDKSAGFMLVNGLKEAGYYLKGLALTDDQQTECVLLRGAPVRARMELIARYSTEASERIEAAHMMNTRAWSQGDPRFTVTRRQHIWRCGSMADWQPKRTAELYEALTGETMTRQLAGKVIEEVWDAFPPSKPPVKRRRRTKPKTKATATSAKSQGAKSRKRRRKSTATAS